MGGCSSVHHFRLRIDTVPFPPDNYTRRTTPDTTAAGKDAPRSSRTLESENEQHGAFHCLEPQRAPIISIRDQLARNVHRELGRGWRAKRYHGKFHSRTTRCRNNWQVFFLLFRVVPPRLPRCLRRRTQKPCATCPCSTCAHMPKAVTCTPNGVRSFPRLNGID